MKRNLLALSLLAALVSAPAFAAEHEGWVYNGLTGVGFVDDHGIKDSAFSSNSNIGYRWGFIGVEAGYTTFGKFSEKATTTSGPIKLDVDVGGWNAGINVNGNLDDNWSVQGRIGAFGWDGDTHVKVGDVRVKFKDDGTDWYAGISLDYNWSWNEAWSKKASVGLGYTYYKIGGNVDSSVGLFGVHSEFRF